MDFDICSKVMGRNDFNYLGLIGSETKWRRFQRRFTQDGITKKQLDRVNCPIGLSEVPGKLPAEIAISIASEVIAFYNAQEDKNQSNKNTSQGVNRNHSQGVNRKITKRVQQQLVENDKDRVTSKNPTSVVRSE